MSLAPITLAKSAHSTSRNENQSRTTARDIDRRYFRTFLRLSFILMGAKLGKSY